MSDETKRDVFEAVLNRLAGYQVFFNGWPRETLDDYKKRYSAALPDDLPVIPKAVGEYIKACKAKHNSLTQAFGYRNAIASTATVNWLYFEAIDPQQELSQREVIRQENTFALAWLLGVWRVEETGEVVKL